MKKLILFTTFLIAVTLQAQSSDDEVNKLSELMKIGTQSTKEKTQDSVIIELKKLIDNSSSSIIKNYGKQAISSLSELRDLSKNVVYSKSLEELTKEDLKNFKVNDDKFKGIAFIHHKKESGNFYPYLSLKNGFLNMRLVASYDGKDWVFFDKIVLLANGKTYEINYNTTDTSVGSGYVYEIGDIRVNEDMLNILKEFSVSDLVEIRFSGKRIYDKKLNKYEMQVLKETLELYDKLKK